MNAIFRDLLLVSGACAMVMGLLLVARKLMGAQAGAWWRSALWMVILLRLWFPVMVGSAVSLYSAQWTRALSPAPLVNTASGDDAQDAAVFPITGENQDELTQTLPDGQGTAHEEPPAYMANGNAKQAPSLDGSKLPVLFYLSGLVLSLVLFGAKYAKLGRRTSGLPRCRDQRINDILNGLTKEMNIHQRVGVYWTRSMPAPALTGVLSPKILLCRDTARQVSDEQMEMILRHELTHLKRRDILKLMLVELTACLHWFNPVLHLCKGIIRQDIELACDEKILRRSSKKEIIEYSQVLAIFSSEDIRKAPGLIMANFTGRGGKKIKERLTMISHFKGGKNFLPGALLLACLLLILAACTSVRNPDAVQTQEPGQSPGPTATPVSMASPEPRTDSSLLEIYLVGETA